MRFSRYSFRRASVPLPPVCPALGARPRALMRRSVSRMPVNQDSPEYTAPVPASEALSTARKYPRRLTSPPASHEPSCETVAPTASSTMAPHLARVSGRFRNTRKRIPVAMILRLFRIWYEVGSTSRRNRNCTLLWILVPG